MEAIVPFMNFFVKQCLEKPDKKTIRSYPVLSFSEKNGVWSFLLPQAQSDTCGINGYIFTIRMPRVSLVSYTDWSAMLPRMLIIYVIYRIQC